MIADAIILKLPNIGISLKLLRIAGGLVILSLLVFYIFQINELTRAGFSIANYERQISQLTQESQGFNADFSFANSLTNLEIILSGSNYEKVDKVYYLRVSASQVAAK